MCGRYYSRKQKQEIAASLRVKTVTEAALPPNFNIAPTTQQAIVRNDRETGERELELLRWGMVPFFAKSLDAFKGFSTFNARAETLATSPTWREPWKKRRCLVPADGFYEWKRTGPKSKQPYAITLTNGEPLAFAGLWDAWRDPANGTWLQSFAIVTTEANEIMSQVHTRMPVILRQSTFDEWLDRDTPQPPAHLLRPCDSGDMQLTHCNPAVGNVRNNGEAMLVCPVVS